MAANTTVAASATPAVAAAAVAAPATLLRYPAAYFIVCMVKARTSSTARFRLQQAHCRCMGVAQTGNPIDGVSPQQMQRATQLWLEKFVIGMNLCPFAQASLPGLQIIVSAATTLDELMEEVVAELQHLSAKDPAVPATSLHSSSKRKLTN